MVLMKRNPVNKYIHSFNLWRDPWIRVAGVDNITRQVSISSILADARIIRALNDPSPLVVVGTHRLLVAILQASIMPRSLGDLGALWHADTFDAEMLAAFAEQMADRFELFATAQPFLQSADLAATQGDKSIASLSPEVPTATNRTLFQHVTDARHWYCGACCARGMVTIPAFATTGGQGFRPSINGVPPLYFLPIGTTLYESLVLSLLSPDYQPRAAAPERASAAWWTSDGRVGASQIMPDVGYLESLLFPARRMRLVSCPGPRMCTNCGAMAHAGASFMTFEMGQWRGIDAPPWDDPFVARRLPRNDAEMPQALRPEAGKALWRSYSAIFLPATQNISLRPAVVSQIASLVDKRGVLPVYQRYKFRIVGMRTDSKAKIFEWLDESLDVPISMLNRIESTTMVENAIRLANSIEYIMIQSFSRNIRPLRSKNDPSNKMSRLKSICQRMIVTYWNDLANPFRTYIGALEANNEAQAQRTWAKCVTDIGYARFGHALTQTGTRAVTLQARVAADAECQDKVSREYQRWLEDNGVHNE
jgi:CRISPR system Cascade subunit CasA